MPAFTNIARNFGFSILDFGVKGDKPIRELFQIRVVDSSSDNLKSKIQNLKWLALGAVDCQK
jgi:hypothetical protein